MPANIQPPFNPPQGASLIARFMGTFKGWLLRKAVTFSTIASSAVTAWLYAKWSLVEQLASQAGADADTLKQLHAQGVETAQVMGALVATAITGAIDILLSRVAAKVAEEPKAPVALPYP